jgi:hypothetical protein
VTMSHAIPHFPGSANGPCTLTIRFGDIVLHCQEFATVEDANRWIRYVPFSVQGPEPALTVTMECTTTVDMEWHEP